MNSDENEEEDGYFHNEDGSREMCTRCCEWLLDDGSCPDPDCEHNRDDELEAALAEEAQARADRLNQLQDPPK